MPTPLIIMSIIGLAIIAWAVSCIIAVPRTHLAMRIVAALSFVPISLFCLWGFAAAMEPGDYHIVWRVGYGVVFLACLIAIGRVLLAKQVSEHVPPA